LLISRAPSVALRPAPVHGLIYFISNLIVLSLPFVALDCA
jgi:hypothetical protein